MVKGIFLFTAGAALGLTLANTLRPGQDPAAQVQTVRDFPNLVQGLQATPGCTGVQVFTLNNNAQAVIAAWFENRKAMEAWYYSPMHQGAMAKFFPGWGKGKKPFAAFKDESAPILVIASITPGDKPIGSGSNLAVSQIAIEGYTPIPGGVALGGTFAPEALKVPGLVRIPAGK